ncbi:hypothetical protein M8J77_006863 [Diaphorina citri]|nr:hypothetical protein M8J77_006863 [Diaphorina citri]
MHIATGASMVLIENNALAFVVMSTNTNSIDIQHEPNYCTFQDVIFYYLCQAIHILSEFSVYNTSNYTNLVCTKESIGSCFLQLNELWKYDEFHVTLFRVFAVILIVNLVLIYVSWNYYGERICERFMKPTSHEVLEDLRKSVAQLKLPKDYSPRL